MKKFIKYILFTVVVLVFSACEDRSDLTVNNDVGLSEEKIVYVAIGNSITAGYQSGSLYEDAQKYSFGNLISQQVEAEYVQPLIPEPGFGNRMEVVSISPFTTRFSPGQTLPSNANYELSYNNLGVPGAVVYDVLNATSSATSASRNPFFDVILRGKGSQFAQAKSLNPNLITLWIGNNDVLGYATSGGTSPSNPTPTATFRALYNALIDSIKSLNSKVAVANIPDVSTITYFNTVGPQIALTAWPTLSALGITGLWYQKSGEGVSSSKVDSLGLLRGEVLLTLQASSYSSQIGKPSGLYYRNTGIAPGSGVDTTKPFAVHPQNPLPNGLVLDPSEILVAKNAVNDFNEIIATAVNQAGFALVDIYTLFNQIRLGDLTGGVNLYGMHLSTRYVTGGLFSLDGVHPSNHGHGVIANEFIKAINSKYTANIPLVDVAALPGSLILTKEVMLMKNLNVKFTNDMFNKLTF